MTTSQNRGVIRREFEERGGGYSKVVVTDDMRRSRSAVRRWVLLGMRRRK